MSPILFVIDGLPKCSKSDCLAELLCKIVPRSRDDAMTNENKNAPTAGISYYELAAVGLSPAPFGRLTYSETTIHTCYLYAIQSALAQLYYTHGQEIKYCRDPLAKVFNDDKLNDHFHKMFDSLAKEQDQESSSPPTKWKRSIPNGIALINVWDVGMNKAVFHFLPALRGHLDNSYLWLFLDLDRDANDLYTPPHLPENKFDKTRKDKDFIMQYRSRIEYLLRPAKLAKSISSDREDVCTVFGVHSGTYEQTQLDCLIEEIQNTSVQANLATVVNTKKVTPINPTDDKCREVLKRKADEIIGAGLESTIQIPFASIFLRSLYYGVDKMYIKKSELKAKAELLNITDDEFEMFCRVFMSLGSIIDVNRIDETSEYVILRPTDFIRGLDKIFYPNEIDPTVPNYIDKLGVVTESTAMQIFEPGKKLMPDKVFQQGDHKLFMDVLVSVDLAVRLKSHQIAIENTKFTEVEENEDIYYIPHARTSRPNLECQPTALHLLYRTNSPIRQLQVLFARSLLEIEPNSQLVFKEASPANVTTFRVNSSQASFEMWYLGETVAFLPLAADENTCAVIIQTCHHMMKSNWKCEKYNFAVMCSKDLRPKTPSRLRRTRHLLPNSTLCETCVEQGRLDKMLRVWNTTLKDVSH